MAMSLKSPATKFIGVGSSPKRMQPGKVPIREPEGRSGSAKLGVRVYIKLAGGLVLAFLTMLMQTGAQTTSIGGNLRKGTKQGASRASGVCFDPETDLQVWKVSIVVFIQCMRRC